MNTFIREKQTIRTGTREDKSVIKHSEKKKHDKTLMSHDQKIC